MGPDNLFIGKYRLPSGITNALPDRIKKDSNEALIEIKKRNYPAAVAIYKRIIADFPGIGALRNNLGCCLAVLERFDEAETEFIEAMKPAKLNRDNGIFVPWSFPREPKRNLIALYKSVLSKKKDMLHAPRNIDIAVNPCFLKRDVREIIGKIRREGIIVAFTKIPRYLSSKFDRTMRWYEKVSALRAEEFDRKNKVNTAGIIHQTELQVNSGNQPHAVYYHGSDSSFSIMRSHP